MHRPLQGIDSLDKADFGYPFSLNTPKADVEICNKYKFLIKCCPIAIDELRLSTYHRTPSGNPKPTVLAQFVNSALFSPRHGKKLGQNDF